MTEHEANIYEAARAAEGYLMRSGIHIKDAFMASADKGGTAIELPDGQEISFDYETMSLTTDETVDRETTYFNLRPTKARILRLGEITAQETFNATLCLPRHTENGSELSLSIIRNSTRIARLFEGDGIVTMRHMGNLGIHAFDDGRPPEVSQSSKLEFSLSKYRKIIRTTRAQRAQETTTEAASLVDVQRFMRLAKQELRDLIGFVALGEKRDETDTRTCMTPEVMATFLELQRDPSGLLK